MMTMDEHRKKLEDWIDKCGDKCIAIGECGLDYSKCPHGSEEEK